LLPRGPRCLTLLALNRSLTEAMPLAVSAEGFSGLSIDRALALRNDDLEAVNTRDDPDRVKPAPLPDVRIDGSTIHAVLSPGSWNVIQLTVADV
jgi:alpha-N-arabinofuranosidase